MKRVDEDNVASLEPASVGVNTDTYVLRLYVTGTTRYSLRAMHNIRVFCDKYLPGRHELQIIDIYQQPSYATSCQILAAPTLVKEFPLPVKRFIGDLSRTERLLKGLNVEVPEEGERVTA